ncbi:MAG TPA: hypothetical protein VNI20_01640 [Fimbriimonadaceae bacterium]|nr:hypothetical protein [Fimbriimonadaceae bacterium]
MTDDTGRYVFSDTLTQNNVQFYVLDMVAGKFVAHADRPRLKDRYISDTRVSWSPGQVAAKIEWVTNVTIVDYETITLRWKPD